MIQNRGRKPQRSRRLASSALPCPGADECIGHEQVLQGYPGTVEDGDLFFAAASGGPPFDDVADGRYCESAGLDRPAGVLEVADFEGLGRQVAEQACPGLESGGQFVLAGRVGTHAHHMGAGANPAGVE
jgi:hypothetical protein